MRRNEPTWACASGELGIRCWAPEEGWDQKGLAALKGASTGSVGTALEVGGGGLASGKGWKGPVKGVPVTNGCCCACKSTGTSICHRETERVMCSECLSPMRLLCPYSLKNCIELSY